MQHLQLNLERSNWIGIEDLNSLLVVVSHRLWIRCGPKLAIGRREIWNGQTRMLVTHGRAEDKLA